MTRTERERLVEQYLEGGMTAAEEQEFFIQVALDDELRRTLKAYGIVERAIRMEREVDTVSHAAARRVVAASLLPSSVHDSEPDPRRRRRWGISTFGGLILALLVGLWFTVRGEDPVAESTAIELSAPATSTSEQRFVPDPFPSTDRVRQYDAAEGLDRPLRSEQQVREVPALPPPPVREERSGPEPIPDRAPETVAVQASSQEDEVPEEPPTQRTEPSERIDSTAGRTSDSEDPQLPIEIDWGGSDE